MADRASTRTVEEVSHAAESALAVGTALEAFARAMRARPMRGRAGGLARARSAWRYADGAFAANSERDEAIEEFECAEYERCAAGGGPRQPARAAHPTVPSLAAKGWSRHPRLGQQPD